MSKQTKVVVDEHGNPQVHEIGEERIVKFRKVGTLNYELIFHNDGTYAVNYTNGVTIEDQMASFCVLKETLEHSQEQARKPGNKGSYTPTDLNRIGKAKDMVIFYVTGLASEIWRRAISKMNGSDIQVVKGDNGLLGQ